MITMREFRQMIADGCDFSRPLHVVSVDVGKKAAKHSAVRVDETFPVNLSLAGGMYDDRGSIEFAHYPEGDVLMPGTLVEALDELLEERPATLLKWVYFFYFPMEYAGMFGKWRHIDSCLLDTSKIHKVYLSEDEPNTLVVEGEYEFGSFD